MFLIFSEKMQANNRDDFKKTCGLSINSLHTNDTNLHTDLVLFMIIVLLKKDLIKEK